jgi:hypothetical protein
VVVWLKRSNTCPANAMPCVQTLELPKDFKKEKRRKKNYIADPSP